MSVRTTQSLESALAKAKVLLARRREAEPVSPPEDGGRYRWFVADREVTDLLEELVEEIEAYRKLARVEVI